LPPLYELPSLSLSDSDAGWPRGLKWTARRTEKARSPTLLVQMRSSSSLLFSSPHFIRHSLDRTSRPLGCRRQASICFGLQHSAGLTFIRPGLIESAGRRKIVYVAQSGEFEFKFAPKLGEAQPNESRHTLGRPAGRFLRHFEAPWRRRSAKLIENFNCRPKRRLVCSGVTLGFMAARLRPAKRRPPAGREPMDAAPRASALLPLPPPPPPSSRPASDIEAAGVSGVGLVVTSYCASYTPFFHCWRPPASCPRSQRVRSGKRGRRARALGRAQAVAAAAPVLGPKV